MKVSHRVSGVNLVVRGVLDVASTALAVCLSCTAFAGDEVQFEIPRQSADAALTTFAQQAGITVLFPFDSVSRVDANPLIGAYDVKKGLEVLLEGTGLGGVLSETGHLTIRFIDKPEGQEAVNRRRRGGGAAPVPGVAATGAADDTVRSRRSTRAATNGQEPKRDVARARAARPEVITVTGTRIRRTDFATPNAVATLTLEDVTNLGVVSAGDMLSQMTSNVASVTLDTTGDGAFFVGAVLPNLRGLNTGFGTRTLTLVNGRRVPATTNGGGVDLGMIPASLVKQMETVTGGAGATYGSDAMAGVVNVILDNELEGTRLNAAYYATAAGDGNQYNFSYADGRRLLDDRAHITVGYEHQTIDPIRNCETAREWCARSWNYIDQAVGAANNNGIGPAGNDPRSWTDLPMIPQPEFAGFGWPRYQVLDNVRYIHTSPYGSLHTNNEVPADPMNGEFVEFTPDGRAIVPYNTVADGLTGPMRAYAYGGADRRVAGGEGKLFSAGYVLRNGSKRDNLYGAFRYDVNPRLAFNAELSLSRNDGITYQERPGFNRETHCIQTDNAFIQPALMDGPARTVLDARMTDPPVGGFGPGGCSVNPAVFLPSRGVSLYKDWTDQVQRSVETETEMGRVLVGAKGGLFGGTKWTWETYLQYGSTDRYQQLVNNRTNFRYSMATDSVLDSATGRPVCRVNATQGQMTRDGWMNFFQGQFGGDLPTAAAARAKVDALRTGCVALDPFGLGASREALAYAWDDLVEYTYTDQWTLSGNFSGELWQGFGAGPARMAAGVDYREDDTDNAVGGAPNPIVRTDFSAQYGDPWVGGTKVTELFAEFELPLLRDAPAAKYLMINLANRRSRSETFRDDPVDPLSVTRYADSYKASWVWSPTDWVRVRATRSADIRQPAARELFYQQTLQGGGFFNFTPNPWRQMNPNGDTWTTIIGANANLRNESSVTETFGLVFTPLGWANSLQVAADYYEFSIKGGISYATGTDPENDDNLPYPVFRCFEYDEPYYCARILFGPPAAGEPNNPRSDIVSVTTTQENTEPYWSRGVDFSASYNHELRGGGRYLIRLLATHTLEQSVCSDTRRLSATETTCLARQNVVGQTGGLLAGGSIFANYTPTPDWSGNLFGTYSKNALSMTAQARYTGSAQGSVYWVGPDDPRWKPNAWFTISQNELPSWITWNATVSYDFGRSTWASFRRLNTLSLQLSVDNVFDKQPNFWSGGNIAGVNTRFFPGIGRAFRLGLQMQF
jgi:iron complex outermembrane recepter protein